MTNPHLKYTVLSGGVGGAKLVLGLHKVLDEGQLQVIVNTGDDFEHFGLPVCPDLDTLMYTLSKQVNTETGWGLRDESWDFMAAVAELDGPDWFRLGDRDIHSHAQRRDYLLSGDTLSQATRKLMLGNGVQTVIWPMSDQPVRTYIKTSDQDIDFQTYFVKLAAAPVATGFDYRSQNAVASPGALAALQQDDLGAIILTPSNPWLSIDPVLSLSDIKTTIEQSPAPVVGISPIVGGKAIKGPTAKLMQELGLEVSALGVAKHYQDILDGFIIDTQDKDQRDAIEALGLKTETTNTVMRTLQDKTALANFTLEFAERIAGNNPR